MTPKFQLYKRIRWPLLFLILVPLFYLSAAIFVHSDKLARLDSASERVGQLESNIIEQLRILIPLKIEDSVPEFLEETLNPLREAARVAAVQNPSIPSEFQPYEQNKLVSDYAASTVTQEVVMDAMELKSRRKAIASLRSSVKDWYTCIAIVALSFLLLFSPARRWIFKLLIRPFPEGFCKACFYNLEGNQSGVCPECGTAVATESPSPA